MTDEDAKTKIARIEEREKARDQRLERLEGQFVALGQKLWAVIFLGVAWAANQFFGLIGK